MIATTNEKQQELVDGRSRNENAVVNDAPNINNRSQQVEMDLQLVLPKNRRLDMIRQISQLSMGSTGGMGGGTNHTRSLQPFAEDIYGEASSIASDPTAEYGAGVDRDTFNQSLADLDLYSKESSFHSRSSFHHRTNTPFKSKAMDPQDQQDTVSVSFFSVDLDKILSAHDRRKK